MPEGRAATGENGSRFVIPTKTAIYFQGGTPAFNRTKFLYHFRCGQLDYILHPRIDVGS
jgi:hypothetical protein